jgi:glucose/arabinose dehydrogenase
MDLIFTIRFGLVVVFLLHGLRSLIAAASLPPNFSEAQVASNLNAPTAMDIAPDGRVFIAEKGGAVGIVKNGAMLQANFYTAAVTVDLEQGLTGIALDPGFATNGYVYLHYVPAGALNTVLARVTAGSGDPDMANPASLVILFNGPPYPAGQAIGGGIGFTLDGKILLSMDTVFVSPANAQQLNNLYGKVLRLNRDGSIPTDNPFFNTATGDNRAIYAYGLRNPYTTVVQPGTGRIFANDVGENSFEEVNEIVAGGNYGWPISEGPTAPPYISPLWSYPHVQGTNGGSAVIGGAFYNPPNPQFPARYVGTYFVADWVNAWVNVIDVNNNNTVFNFRTPDSLLAPVAVKVAPDGALYVLGLGSMDVNSTSGLLLRITYADSSIEPIESWRQANFGSTANSGPGADDADPDSDGVLNIAEYGSGMDPNAASRDGLPTGSFTLQGASDYLTLTFRRNTRAADLIYRVEASGDLNDWTQLAGSTGGAVTSGPGFVGETGADPLKTVVVRDTAPVSLTGSRFIRLIVTR